MSILALKWYPGSPGGIPNPSWYLWLRFARVSACTDPRRPRSDPNLPIFLYKRYIEFNNITNNFKEHELRNSQESRNRLCELICVLTLSSKKKFPKYKKIEDSDLQISILRSKMIAKNDFFIKKIVPKCKNSKHKRIVITHGTDTMVNTAEAIAKAKLDKTIILTGAMVPYEFGSSSDGFFNLGCALSFVQTFEKGVYITMHGKYFNWNEVKKNNKKGIFEKK